MPLRTTVFAMAAMAKVGVRGGGRELQAPRPGCANAEGWHRAAARGGAGPVTFTGRAVSGMKRCACCQAAGSGPIMRHRYLDRVAAFNGVGRVAGPKPPVMQCRMPLRPVRVRTVPVDFDKGEDAWQMRGKARWGCQTGCRPIGEMARPERFELPTTWFVARYSIQLSYGRLAGSKRSRDCPY